MRQGNKLPPTKSRSMEFCAGAAGNSSTEYGCTKICTNEKQGAKIPLLKVLEIGLRAIQFSLHFKKFPKQGLGQSPKVLSNIHPKQNDPSVVPSSH
jgi:hypothetical protein